MGSSLENTMLFTTSPLAMDCMCLVVVFIGKFPPEHKLQMLSGQRELQPTGPRSSALDQDVSGKCPHARRGP